MFRIQDNMVSVRLGYPVFTKALNRISTLSSRYCECQHETEHWGEGSRAPKEAAAVTRIPRGDFFFHFHLSNGQEGHNA